MSCRRQTSSPLTHQLFSSLVLLACLCSNGCRATAPAKYCRLNRSDKYGVAYTITVDNSGHGPAANFTTVQRAIDSIPVGNSQWVRIQISPGKFTEKVVIRENKPCIFLHGAGRASTSIEWDDHEDKPTSPIFAAFADDIVAKGITFKVQFFCVNLQNKYNIGPGDLVWKRATAARIGGDRSAFFECGFIGLQDTFLDDDGRHLFSSCYIEGAMDFIYGAGKSIYKECEISLNIGKYEPGLAGSITAQKKELPGEEGGFVFDGCEFTGTGKAILGRAWGAYSTVVVYNSSIGDIVVPQGWDAWGYVGHE
ncbi:unnamed protein product [Linum tenue]|uniref:pectinesterase n=1 Tax=Linum tenue TaxID=586396 RepID=A0AAV0LUY6_9ROSI|nr:unnamed protein product [Linum tenue]